MTTHSHQSIKPPREELISSRRWKDNIYIEGAYNIWPCERSPVCQLLVVGTFGPRVKWCFFEWQVSNALGWRRLATKKTWALFSLFFSSQPYMHQKMLYPSLSSPFPLQTATTYTVVAYIDYLCWPCLLYSICICMGVLGVSVRYVYPRMDDELYIFQVTEAYVCVYTSANCQQFFFQPPHQCTWIKSTRLLACLEIDHSATSGQWRSDRKWNPCT